jgi:lactoylglutathione lyase
MSRCEIAAVVLVRGLFEAHLMVSDLDRSIGFYRDVLGLPLAYRLAARQVAFFWVPAPEKAMLGPWSRWQAGIERRAQHGLRP